MSTRPSRLNGLRHLALLVEDLEACERFYVDILGMSVLNRAHEDLVYLTCGNDNLSLGRGYAEPNGPQAMDHFGFVVDSLDDLHAWHKYLSEQGVTMLDTPFAHGDGTWSFHVLDPAGNKVQPIYHPAVSGQVFSQPK